MMKKSVISHMFAWWSLQMPIALVVFTLLGVFWQEVPVSASPPTPITRYSQMAVPILGVTLDRHRQPVGVVIQVIIYFIERNDQNGLQILFQNNFGKFSPMAKESVHSAITRVSRLAHVRSDSWTVYLTFPYSRSTMYGESLSAMVGLSVLALAKGHAVIYGRSITGTITENGQIGKVVVSQKKLKQLFRRI